MSSLYHIQFSAQCFMNASMIPFMTTLSTIGQVMDKMSLFKPLIGQLTFVTNYILFLRSISTILIVWLRINWLGARRVNKGRFTWILIIFYHCHFVHVSRSQLFCCNFIDSDGDGILDTQLWFSNVTQRCEHPYENGKFLRDDCVVPLILSKTTQTTQVTLPTTKPTTGTYTHLTTTTTSQNTTTLTSTSSSDPPTTTLVHQQPANCPEGLTNTAWSESLGCIWANAAKDEEHGYSWSWVKCHE